MPKNRKTYPWVVYLHQGIFANTIDRFPTRKAAEIRVQQVRKRYPGEKVNFYFERPNPAPINNSRVSENAEKN